MRRYEQGAALPRPKVVNVVNVVKVIEPRPNNQHQTGKTQPMEHRDKITIQDEVWLPTTLSHSRGYICRGVAIAKGIHKGDVYAGDDTNGNPTYTIEHTNVLVLAIVGDVHHLKLDQEQARALAKVLMHYAKTGEVKA